MAFRKPSSHNGVQDAIVGQPLDLVQERLPALGIQLAGLLDVEVVQVRLAPHE